MTFVPRSYDPAALLPLMPTSEAFALAWVRYLLKATPDEAGKFPDLAPTDAEVRAALAVDAVRDAQNVTHYRPHITAARMYLGNPEVLRNENGAGWTRTARDAQEIISAWLEQGRAFDALIPAGTVLPPFVLPGSAGGTPGTPGTLRPERSKSVPVRVTGI